MGTDSPKLGIYSRNKDPSKNAVPIVRIAEEHGIRYEILTPEMIQQGIDDTIDVVLFPGGVSRTQARVLNDTGRRNVTSYCERGGGYIGICAGAFLALSGRNKLGLLDVEPIQGLAERNWIGKTNRQVILAIRGTQEAKSVLGKYASVEESSREKAKYVIAAYHNGPMFPPHTKGNQNRGYKTLAAFAADYEGYRPGYDEPVRPHASAIICVDKEEGKQRGRIVLFSPHIESSTTPELHPYLVRAIRWCGARDNV